MTDQVPEEAITADDEAIMTAILPAVHDPGSVLPRLESESLPHWQSRAVLAYAVPLIRAVEVRKHVQEQDAILRDLGALLNALGLGDHARPESPHEVMLQCIAEAKRLKTGRVLSAISVAREADCPQPFGLYRHQDVTGVSGSGTVAYGVRFADGRVVIRWLGGHPSTVIWDSLDDAMAVHGHDGKTQVVWLAAPFSEMGLAEQEAAAAERERIAKLADDHGAAYTQEVTAPGAIITTTVWEPFADLIRRQP